MAGRLRPGQVAAGGGRRPPLPLAARAVPPSTPPRLRLARAALMIEVGMAQAIDLIAHPEAATAEGSND